MKFSDLVIYNTVEKLLKGEDYRDEIVNAINVEFLDFALAFFRQILDAKLSEKNINIDWYKKSFINNEKLDSNELAIFAGINKKTITNIYGSATRQITIEAANANIKYLENILKSLEELGEERLGLSISHKNVSVELNLSESLIVSPSHQKNRPARRGVEQHRQEGGKATDDGALPQGWGKARKYEC